MRPPPLSDEVSRLASELLLHRWHVFEQSRAFRPAPAAPQRSLGSHLRGFSWRVPAPSAPELHPAAVPEEGDRALFERVDRALLSLLGQAGYVPPSIPVITPSLSQGDEMSHAAFGPTGNACVVLPTDRLGNHEIKEEGPNGGDNTRPLHEVADEALSDPSFHLRGIYLRWFVLCHEAAHVLFRDISDPFRPSAGVMDEAGVEAVNAWVVGPLAPVDVRSRALLNESHSDVYALMLLLESTGHDPVALEAIEEVLSFRRDVRQASDKKFMGRLDRGEAARLPSIHATDFAMRRAMEAREQWKGLPPAQLQAQALRHASDGIFDYLNPHRSSPRGEAQGPALMAIWGWPELNPLKPLIRISQVAYAQAASLPTPFALGAPLSHAFGECCRVALPLIDEAVASWKSSSSSPIPDPRQWERIWDGVLPALGRALTAPSALPGLGPAHVRGCQEATAALAKGMLALHPSTQAGSIPPAPAAPSGVTDWRKARDMGESPLLPVPVLARPRV